jgi:hypothetical protein
MSLRALVGAFTSSCWPSSNSHWCLGELSLASQRALSEPLWRLYDGSMASLRMLIELLHSRGNQVIVVDNVFVIYIIT